MVYTEYISKFKLLMNIIHLEGRMHEFEKLKRSRLFMDKREVGLHQMHLQNHLIKLTQLEAPHRLLEIILTDPSNSDFP